MLLRFVVMENDPDSGRRKGVLVAAHELRDDGDLTVEEHRILREALQWFNDHLDIPPPLDDAGNHRAISWFKPAAKKPLAHMWALVAILRDHGYHVDVLKTQDPGIVLYEDGWQVVAKPGKGRRVRW